MTLAATLTSNVDSSPDGNEPPRSRLRELTRELMTTEIQFVPHRVDRKASAGWIENLDQYLAELACTSDSAEAQQLALLPGANCRILSREQEQLLFRHMNFLKWRANSLRTRLDPRKPSQSRIDAIRGLLDDAARVRNVLVDCNLRLVLSIARKHSNSQTEFEDFVSEGFAILLRCVDLFDAARGFRFSTYLTHALQRHLYRCLLRKQMQRKRQPATDTEILNNVPSPEVETGDSPDASLLCARILQEAAGQLDPRETRILARRYGLDGAARQNLREIADDLGLSKERVRQLQMRALKKLQDVAVQLNVTTA